MAMLVIESITTNEVPSDFYFLRESYWRELLRSLMVVSLQNNDLAIEFKPPRKARI